MVAIMVKPIKVPMGVFILLAEPQRIKQVITIYLIDAFMHAPASTLANTILSVY
jgi:hypothetical protein